MNQTEQGVLQKIRWGYPLAHVLLLLTFFLAHDATAEALPAGTQDDNKTTHRVFAIYSPGSTLLSNIANKLSDELSHARPDITVIEKTPGQEITEIDQHDDIIIGIGQAGAQQAVRHYPNIKKLLISTDPNSSKPYADKGDATLYMTQSYCRQIKFIRLLNEQWQTISILSSRKKPVDIQPLRQCADRYDFALYVVETSAEDNQTSRIKQALAHSDVLLALPDRNIYNSKTVKNILLTSYRYRKPVIAFSKNFVNAGALASIHSNTGQIAKSGCKLIQQYFDSGLQFKKALNFPENFDININHQVFRALDLDTPDVDELKQALQEEPQGHTGESL